MVRLFLFDLRDQRGISSMFNYCAVSIYLSTALMKFYEFCHQQLFSNCHCIIRYNSLWIASLVCKVSVCLVIETSTFSITIVYLVPYPDR